MNAEPAEQAPDRSWIISAEFHSKKLDFVLKTLMSISWSEARRMLETGKVSLNGEVITSGERAVRKDQCIELRLRAPKPQKARLLALEHTLLVHADASVVVVRKPAGMNTIPFGEMAPDEERACLDSLVRELLARRDRVRGRAELGVVHRLDKATSGLLVFTRTVAAKKHLSQQFRMHTVHRLYLAVAHGDVRKQTRRSHLMADRGDGLRGSFEESGYSHGREGQLAVTHIEPKERLRGATLIACKLETGRTHQIRIHLAEAGHPIVGENVYIRDFKGPPIPSARLLLHAAELGFEHPATGKPMFFREDPPEDFERELKRLRL